MSIETERIKELRDESGAGIMDCRNALFEASGDREKALQILKERNLLQVKKKTERSANQGVVEAYIHGEGRIGALVEVNCETDFVARTAEFKELAHNLAMQVAAMTPQYISAEEIPEGVDVEAGVACLLLQPYIKDTTTTVQDIINENIAKVGENIKVNRFSRFELGT